MADDKSEIGSLQRERDEARAEANRFAERLTEAVRDGVAARSEVERLTAELVDERACSRRLADALRGALPMHETRCPIPRDDCDCWVSRQRAALAEYDSRSLSQPGPLSESDNSGERGNP